MLIEILIKNPVLILFLIIAMGYLIGLVKIGSFSLGVAGSLFAGIAVSALNPNLALPPLIYTLGLILFIYATGIALGPTFFAGLRKTGLKDNLFTFAILLVGAGGAMLAAKLIHLDTAMATGMYTGTFTVTPALAGVLEALDPPSAVPVVGYSLAYPFSIISSLLLIGLFRRFWKVDQQESNAEDVSLNPRTVRYTREEPCIVHEIGKLTGTEIVVSRISTRGDVHVPQPQDVVNNGDLVTVVSTKKDFKKAVKWMGEVLDEEILFNPNSKLRERRVFVSNSKLAGRNIGALKLYTKYKVVITRVRRGDIDMVAHDNFIVELGDRVRIVGDHKDIDRAAEYLGDSYRSISHIDIFTFASGIVMGIALGVVSIPLPGGNKFSLGAVGGTIIVALILGALRRTGPFVWQIPYSTSLSLRQLGLMMFLAGIGSTAGSAWVKALSDPISYQLMGASFLIALTTCTIMIIIGYKVLKIPFTRLSGMVAAMNTQPATLAYANDQTKTEDANIGYASVYPMSLVVKIILAQIILILLA